MYFDKNNKNFTEFDNFIKIQTSEILKEFAEKEKVNFMVCILMMMKISCKVSEQYLKYSDYIPLKIVSQEIIDEREKIQIKLKSIPDVYMKKRKAEKHLKQLGKTVGKKSADKRYILFLLENDKFTVREIRKIKKTVKDSEFENILSDVLSKARKRIIELEYLLSV